MTPIPVLLLAAAFAAAHQPFFRKSVPAKPVEVVLFHTNDIHGYLMPNPETGTGGLASLVTLMRAERRPWLWFDSGDWYQGTPLGNHSKGEDVVAMLGQAGLTATVIGNHEWDFGAANLRRVVNGAKFGILGTNIDVVGGREPLNADRLEVFHVGGYYVGVIGLTTDSSQTEERVAPDRVDPHADRRAAAYDSYLARRLDVHAVVALTHLGIEKADGRVFSGISPGDLAVAESMPNVAAILGGHVHYNIVQPEFRTSSGRRVVITQTDGFLKSVYRIVLSFDPGTRTLVDVKAERIPLKADRYPPDAATLTELTRRNDAAMADLRKPLGSSEARMSRGAMGDSQVGRVVADAWRLKTGADVASVGSFGLRANIPAGVLTGEDIYKIMPFDNELMLVHISGSALRAFLASCADAERVYCELSGARVRYVPVNGPERVSLREVLIGGVPLDDARVYKLAVDDYTLKSRLKGLAGEPRGVSRDALAEHVRQFSPLRPPEDQRWFKEAP